MTLEFFLKANQILRTSGKICHIILTPFKIINPAINSGKTDRFFSMSFLQTLNASNVFLLTALSLFRLQENFDPLNYNSGTLIFSRPIKSIEMYRDPLLRIIVNLSIIPNFQFCESFFNNKARVIFFITLVT